MVLSSGQPGLLWASPLFITPTVPSRMRDFAWLMQLWWGSDSQVFGLEMTKNNCDLFISKWNCMWISELILLLFYQHSDGRNPVHHLSCRQFQAKCFGWWWPSGECDFFYFNMFHNVALALQIIMLISFAFSSGLSLISRQMINELAVDSECSAKPHDTVHLHLKRERERETRKRQSGSRRRRSRNKKVGRN